MRLIDATDTAGMSHDVTTAIARHRTRALIALSLCEFERSGIAAAMVMLDRADGVAATLGDPELSDMCSWQRAGVLARSGRLREAMAVFDSTTTSMTALGPRDQAVILLTRGMTRLSLDALDDARADFARVRDIAVEHGLGQCEFMALHNLGFAHYVAGDLPAALELMEQANTMPVSVSRVPALHDHGRALMEAGLIREAAETLQEAEGLCTDRRQGQLLGEIELDLARALTLIGDLAAARRRAASARARFRRRGIPAFAARAQLTLLAVACASAPPGHAVARLATELADELQARGDLVGSAEAALIAAQAHSARGRWPLVAQCLTRTGPLVRSGSLSTRMRLSLVQARAADAAGHADDAVGILRAASRDLCQAPADSPSLDLRSAVSLHGVHLVALDIEISLRNGAEAVLQATERWRAPSARLAGVTAPDDPELAERFAVLRRLREETNRAFGADRAALAAQVAQLEREIRRREWSRPASPDRGNARADRGRPSAAEPLSSGQIRDALRQEDAALASFFAHRGSVWVVRLDARGAIVREVIPSSQARDLAQLVTADLDALGASPNVDLTAVISASLDAGLRRVDELLLLPLGVGDRRLVVLPSRAMPALPWAMLPSRVGTPTVMARSATSWAVDRREVTGPLSVHAAAGPHLAHAVTEVQDVGRVWREHGTTVTSRTTAGELRDALRRCELVHVAAHGNHHHDSPLFSSVEMTDGALFTHELQQSGVGAGHVVLSACDVGRATLRPGEEPLGLASSLLALGASSVVAAMCHVPDAVAARTMAAYHRRLLAGTEAAEALAEVTADAEPLARAFLATGSSWRLVLGGRRGRGGAPARTRREPGTGLAETELA